MLKKGQGKEGGGPKGWYSASEEEDTAVVVEGAGLGLLEPADLPGAAVWTGGATELTK